MHPYQAQVQHAASSIVQALYNERQELSRVRDEQRAAEAELRDIQLRVSFLSLNPDLDDDGIGTSEHWRGHFDVAPLADRKKEDADMLASALAAREASTEALATALLHIAHTAMAKINEGLQNTPEGRDIGTLKLRGVVWQARNQAMHHFEEKEQNDFLQNVFDTLANERGPAFKAYKTRNLAFEVVELLGWESMDQFNQDLAALLAT